MIIDRSKLFCNAILLNGTKCNGEIDYDDGYNYLICSKCGKVYKAQDLSKALINTKDVIVTKGVSKAMKIKIKSGDSTLYTINTINEAKKLSNRYAMADMVANNARIKIVTNTKKFDNKYNNHNSQHINSNNIKTNIKNIDNTTNDNLNIKKEIITINPLKNNKKVLYNTNSSFIPRKDEDNIKVIEEDSGENIHDDNEYIVDENTTINIAGNNNIVVDNNDDGEIDREENDNIIEVVEDANDRDDKYSIINDIIEDIDINLIDEKHSSINDIIKDAVIEAINNTETYKNINISDDDTKYDHQYNKKKHYNKRRQNRYNPTY